MIFVPDEVIIGRATPASSAGKKSPSTRIPGPGYFNDVNDDDNKSVSRAQTFILGNPCNEMDDFDAVDDNKGDEISSSL